MTGSGTQNYVTKFNNVGGTAIGNSLIYDNGTNVGISTASPAGLFDVGNGTMTVLSSGNVGIGTSSPAQQLDVKGSSELEINTANTPYIQLQSGSTAVAKLYAD